MGKNRVKLHDVSAREREYLKKQKHHLEEKRRKLRDERKKYHAELEECQKKKELLERKLHHSTEQFFTVMEVAEETELKEVNQKIAWLSEECISREKEEKKYAEKIGHINAILSLLEDDGKKEDEAVLSGMDFLCAQEYERKRIAMELHDSTVQNLTNMVHKTELCMRVIDMDPIRAKLEMESLCNTIRESIDEMRGIIYNLRPMAIDDLGLGIAAERFIKQLQLDNPGKKIVFCLEGEEPELEPVVKLTIFRTLQEACNNAIKHAEADNICVRLSYGEDIELYIEDDGIGFQLDNLNLDGEDKKKHFGLSIMKERVIFMNGEFSIDSKEGRGTIISARIPGAKEEEKE